MVLGTAWFPCSGVGSDSLTWGHWGFSWTPESATGRGSGRRWAWLPAEAGWRAGDTCVGRWGCVLPPGGAGRWTPSRILADVTGAGGALGLGGPRDVLPGPLGHLGAD